MNKTRRKTHKTRPIRGGNGTEAGLVAGDKTDLNRKVQPELKRIA